MPTFDINTALKGFDQTQFFAFRENVKSGDIKYFSFDFAAPAGNQDATINNLKKGDLIYTTTGEKIKKIEVETANATLTAADCIIGFVMQVFSDDGTVIYDEGRTFTEDGGRIACFTGKNVEIYTNQIFIHSQNTTDPDTRINLAPATHAAGSAVLEGLIKVANKSTSTPTFILN